MSRTRFGGRVTSLTTYNTCCNDCQLAMSPSAVPRGRRLSPEARRQHIIEAARGVFSEHPYSAVSTAEVAEAAGVARSLVHHYFGGIRGLFLAVIAQGGAALAD